MKWLVCFCWLSALLAGCMPAAPTAAPGLTQTEAIAAALKLAATSRPEIGGAQGTPTNVTAEKMTLAQALRRHPGEVSLPEGYEASSPVWLVTMDGIWPNEAPFPGGLNAPTQMPYLHYGVILNALTGAEIQSWASQ